MVSGGSGPTPAPTGTPDASGNPVAGIGGVDGTTGGGTPGGGTTGGGPLGGGSLDGSGPIGAIGSSGSPGGNSTTDNSPQAAVLRLLGGGNGGIFDQWFRVVPVLTTTTGLVVLWAAFFMIGKRRRDGEPPAPDPVLAAHAASAYEQPVGQFIPLRPYPQADVLPPAVVQTLPPGVDPTEAALPRWRRPSLMQARKADPIRNPLETVSLTFADGAVGPVDGKERRRIRYRLVSLLDSPDEVRANEIGVLDKGDEVQLIEQRGTYWLVLCPDGGQGWVHKMVLGEEVVDAGPYGERGEEAGEDLLTNYLAARQKTA